MRRPILMQRLTQMNVVPDVLPNVDPIVDVQVRFVGKDTRPGVFVKSKDSERPPTFKIIPFRQGENLCTVAVIDPGTICHFQFVVMRRLFLMLMGALQMSPMWRRIDFDTGYIGLCSSPLSPPPQVLSFTYSPSSNIFISPSQTQAIGTGAKPSDTIVPYLPPHVQKGSPYHRYSMFVFKQPDDQRIDPTTLVGKIDRETFNMRNFQAKHKLETIGAFMWRGEWDEGTKQIMQKHNLPGWDIMYTRRKD